MPLLALTLIAVVSLIIVRIGATALKMTGLSTQVADFQAISCFFGVGFTTTEAEMIVSHPARRRIATHLIIAGNIGLTSALSALIVTLVGNDSGGRDWFDMLFRSEGTLPTAAKIGLIIAMVLLIAVVFRMGIVKQVLEVMIRATLNKSGVVRAMDYDTVLHARDGYVVSHFEIDPGNWLIGQTLGEALLGRRGVIAIGILRESGEYVGVPDRDTALSQGDVLTVYGVEDRLREVLHGESSAP